jgi:hypothetical protein
LLLAFAGLATVGSIAAVGMIVRVVVVRRR